MRKATFKVNKNAGVRHFTAVNGRAKRYSKALTGRVHGDLLADDIRTINSNGTQACDWLSLERIDV